jgi:hypothetical protein
MPVSRPPQLVREPRGGRCRGIHALPEALLQLARQLALASPLSQFSDERAHSSS